MHSSEHWLPPNVAWVGIRSVFDAICGLRMFLLFSFSLFLFFFYHGTPVFLPHQEPKFDLLSFRLLCSLLNYYYYYSTLDKITQFSLVESSTINPKLYSVGVPIKFPWKRRVRKKMADSRFAILMALFLPNKELFTNFEQITNYKPCMKTRRRQVKLFSVSHKTELASCHNSCVILMTMLSCKLKYYIILLQFVILLNVL